MNCVEQLAARFGIDRKQAADIMDQVQYQREKLEAKIADNAHPVSPPQQQFFLPDLETKLIKRMEEMSRREYETAMAERRALQLSYTRRMELFRLATESFKGREWEAFPAVLAGSQRDLRGSRKSVDASQVALRGYYIGGLISDLEALGNGDHLKLLL